MDRAEKIEKSQIERKTFNNDKITADERYQELGKILLSGKEGMSCDIDNKSEKNADALLANNNEGRSHLETRVVDSENKNFNPYLIDEREVPDSMKSYMDKRGTFDYDKWQKDLHDRQLADAKQHRVPSDNVVEDYKEPREGNDFKYQDLSDKDGKSCWGRCLSNGEIQLDSSLQNAPPEARNPHFEHEKEHKDGMKRDDPRHMYPEEKWARMRQDTSWQSVPEEKRKELIAKGEDYGNEANHNLLFDKDGHIRDDWEIFNRLTNLWGYDFEKYWD